MTIHDYWTKVKNNAASNLHDLTGKDAPESEHDIKCLLTHAMMHGTYAEAADAIVEAIEWMTACHMGKSVSE